MNLGRPLPPLHLEREQRQQLENIASSRSPIAGFERSNGHGHPPGLILLASSAAAVLVLLAGLCFFNCMETPVAGRV